MASFLLRPSPTSYVLRLSHWLQVVRVHTSSDPTQVVQDKARRDGAYQKLVGEAVGHPGTPVHGELSVPLGP